MNSRKQTDPCLMPPKFGGSPTQDGLSTEPPNSFEGTRMWLEKLVGKNSNDSTTQNNLPTLPTLQPLKFPTFFELTQLPESSGVKEEKGLFQELLGSPEVLFSGVLENPEVYEDGVAELLQMMLAGKRRMTDLTTEERHLLDRATVEFAQAVKKVPKFVQQPAPKPRAVEEDEEPDLEYAERAVQTKPLVEDLPISPAAPTFWWKKH